jgi:hypothetical protein
VPEVSPEIYYVLLESGSGPQYPYGEIGCSYQLFLPLRADGRLDAEALRQCGAGCRGVRLRASDGEANGRLSLDSRGRVVLQYDEFEFYASTLLLRAAPVTAGNFVRIIEHDGEKHDYRIVSTRRAPAPAPVTGRAPDRQAAS